MLEGRGKREEGSKRSSFLPSSFPHLPSSISPLPSEKGFTFIEILMTLTVIALLFVPIMQLFSNSLYSTNDNLEAITAMNLAQSEMERVINLNYTKDQLRKLGTEIIPPVDKPALELNKTLWRVKRETIEESDPLEVHVSVYKEGQPEKTMVRLVTLIEDLMWDQVKEVSST